MHAHQRAPAGELERIVRAAAGGDHAAWNWLHNRFARRVLGAARAVGLTHHDAEDAAQATWARLFRNITRIHEPASLAAWLTTTARREGLRLRRKSPREEPMGDEVPSDEPISPELDHQIVAAARSAAFAAALTRLPERHRELMRALTAEPAPSYAEVSARLGIPIGSIGPIRARSLARLRRDPALRALLDADG
jgi:RNA polymerase sigma factor (sigma-70 family)